ncbi:MAG: hypothetical protein ABSA75_13310 [Candidatus Bathyarchaeia archaeon]|jgi:hypothetical protein
MYTLYDFDFTEKRIEDALSKLISQFTFATPILIVNEVAKPWTEIQAAS